MRHEVEKEKRSSRISGVGSGPVEPIPQWSAVFVIVLVAIIVLRWTTEPAQAAGDPILRLKALVARNAFNLNPPQTNAPPKEEEPPPAEVGELFLTGFSTMISPTTVYLMSVKDGTNSYYSLSEGQSQKGIQALDIDPDLKKVKIRRDGKLMTLNFKDHGRKNTQSKRPTPAGKSAPQTASNQRGSSNRGANTSARGLQTGGRGPAAGMVSNNGRGTVAGVNSGGYNTSGRNISAGSGGAQVVSRGRNGNPATVDLRPPGINSAAEQRILMETYNALRDPGSPPLPGVVTPNPVQNMDGQGDFLIDDGY